MRAASIGLLLLATGCKTLGELPPAVSEWIPFDRSQGHILFDVTINGRRAKAILDSGAEISAISRSFVESHKVGTAGSGVVIGAFGRKRLDMAKDFDVAMVGEHGPDGGVTVKNAFVVEKTIGEADLLLGLQFFRRLVLQIDYPSSKFRYMTRSASTLAEHANIEMRRSEGFTSPLVKVEVGGRSLWVMLDTGAAGSIYLPRRTAKEGGWLDHAKPAGKMEAQGVTKEVEVELMVLDRLKIGPYELEAIPLAVQNHVEAHKHRPEAKLGSRVVAAEEAPPALLGFDILRHFVVTIDYDAGLLHLYDPGR